MNKSGIGTEQVLSLILLIAGILVVGYAFITITERLRGPTEAEGLRTKVELAAGGKSLSFGTLTASPQFFSCGTQRVYWDVQTIEELANEIEKVVRRVQYSYGEDQQLDFFSDFNLKEQHLCFVCVIASNNKQFGPSEELSKHLIYDKTFIRENPSPPPKYDYYGPFFGYHKEQDIGYDFETEPREFLANYLIIGSDDLLFVGYAVEKSRAVRELFGMRINPNPFLADEFTGRTFVMNQKDLNDYCSQEYLFIDDV